MASRQLRIFQIAKDLNISHTEILSFLKSKDIEVTSHMSPVDENTHQLILSEFAKDKANVERYRKDQVRREIHDTRIKETQTSGKKLKLLSLGDQRKLEVQEAEKAKEAEISKKKLQLEAAKKAEADKIEAEKRKQKAVERTSSDKKQLNWEVF